MSAIPEHVYGTFRHVTSPSRQRPPLRSTRPDAHTARVYVCLLIVTVRRHACRFFPPFTDHFVSRSFYDLRDSFSKFFFDRAKDD